MASAVQLDSHTIGSAGSLVGAAMETAGHYMQSSYLDLIANGLGSTAGAFAMMVGIVAALTIIAIGGNYKFGLWVLIGPPLFFMMVVPRVDSCGAKYKFGAREYPQDIVFNATRGIVDAEQCQSNPAKVSLVFSLWNDFSSLITTQLTEILKVNFTGKFGGRDIDLIKKTDNFINISNAEVSDPALKEFISALLNRCHYYYMLQLKLSDDKLSDEAKMILKKELDTLGGTADFNLAEEKYSNLKAWLIDGIGVLDANGRPTALAGVPAEHFTTPTSTSGSPNFIYNCVQLWDLGIAALRIDATDILSQAAAVGNGSPSEAQGGVSDEPLPGLTPEQAREQRLQAYDRLAQKMGMRVDPKEGTITLNNSNPDVGTHDMLTVVNEIAVRSMLREMSTLDQTLRGDVIDQIPQSTPSGQRGSVQEVNESMRSILHREEFRGKTTILRIAMAMPYIQGVLLYFLSMSFPFFAFTLLVPGRHQTMLLWFGLWLWVKSWWPGMAVVMVIDDLLYKLMPHGAPLLKSAEMNLALSDSPLKSVFNAGEAMKAVLEVDPTYSAATYYNIIGTCMAAVPVLTAFLIKKGGGELLDAVSQGFDGFAGGAEKSLSQYAASQVANSDLSKVRMNAENQMQRRWGEAMHSPEVEGNQLKSIFWGTVAQFGLSGALKSMDEGVASKIANNIAAPVGGAFGQNAQTALKNFALGPSNQKGSLLKSVEAAIPDKEVKAYATMMRDKYRNEAESNLALKLKMIAYDETNTSENRRLMSDARLQGIYAHSMFASYPGGDRLNAIAADNIEWANLGKEWINTQWQRVVRLDPIRDPAAPQ